jgi:hypothetical protein
MAGEGDKQDFSGLTGLNPDNWRLTAGGLSSIDRINRIYRINRITTEGDQ